MHFVKLCQIFFFTVPVWIYGKLHSFWWATYLHQSLSSSGGKDCDLGVRTHCLFSTSNWENTEQGLRVNNKAGFVDIDIKIHVEGALEIQIIHFQVFCDTNKVYLEQSSSIKNASCKLGIFCHFLSLQS